MKGETQRGIQDIFNKESKETREAWEEQERRKGVDTRTENGRGEMDGWMEERERGVTGMEERHSPQVSVCQIQRGRMQR